MPFFELAFDTSGSGGTLALAKDGVVWVERALLEGRRHNVELVATLEKEMSAAGLAPGDLSVVHVGVGPGSFTGLRTGCAAAQALALALPGCRFTRVPAADALFHAQAQVAPGSPVLVSLAWKRDTAFGAVYGADGGFLLPPAEHAFEALFAASPPGTRWVGEAPPELACPPHIVRHAAGEGQGAQVRAASVLAVGRQLAARGEFVAGGGILPIYPRQPEAVALWEARKKK